MHRRRIATAFAAAALAAGFTGPAAHASQQLSPQTLAHHLTQAPPAADALLQGADLFGVGSFAAADHAPSVVPMRLVSYSTDVHAAKRFERDIDAARRALVGSTTFVG